MDVLKLQTNVPVQVAFKYPTGKPCDGLSGPQKMFTLVDGRIIFLSVPAAERIEQQLAVLNVGSDDVDLCKAEVKQGNRKGIEYQIKRVNPPQQNGNGANGYQPLTPPSTKGQNEQPNGNGNAPAPVNGDRPKTKIEDALKTVAAALLAAERYAQEIVYQAWPKQFTGDEVVRLAATLLINGARENGGVR